MTAGGAILVAAPRTWSVHQAAAPPAAAGGPSPPPLGPAGAAILAAALRTWSVQESIALAVAAGVAVALAWIAAVVLSRRVRGIAEIAERYVAGDVARREGGYGDDEIGTVSRVLDASLHEIGRRAAELETDRVRMEAIVAGMGGGVLLVN